MSREIRLIEPYTAGEKPKIDVQFYEEPTSLNGFDVEVRVARDGEEITLAGGVEWIDDEAGQARVTFGEGDLAVTEGEPWSVYRMEVWAGDGTDRIATLLVMWYVYPQVGAAVTI